MDGMMDRDTEIRLIGHPRLSLDKERVDVLLPGGLPVADYLRLVWPRLDGVHARVFIDGRAIEQAEWETCALTPGSVLTARAIPTGDEGGKSALRIIALVGVVALAIFTAGGGLAALPGFGALTAGSISAGLAGAAVSIAGSLAINMLIPPPRPRLDDLSGGRDNSPTLSLTGSSNAFAPYAPIPRVYGTHRIYPPLAGRTFTEIVGADQFLRMLFCFGYGPLELKDFRIGETALDQFEGVELELRYGYPDDTPLVLFPNDVFEDPLSIALTSTFVQRTSQMNAKELSVDITFPSGVGQQVGPDLLPFLMTIFVEYRKVGESVWIPLDYLGQPSTVQTNFSGANNDLVFTSRIVGAKENDIKIVFTPTSGAHGITTSAVAHQGKPVSAGRIITIGIVNGVSTSSAVKSSIEANALANEWVIVTHAPGNSGAGTITIPAPVFPSRVSTITYQLSGGINSILTFMVQGPSRKQVRVSRRFLVPTLDQYEVQVRVTEDTPDPKALFLLNTAFWTALRTIQNTPPVIKSGLAFAALRIKATGQLNGSIDQFSAIATSLLPDWNGTAWELAPTSNPASIYRDVLQGTANRRPKTDAQMDLPAIQAFHAKCITNGFFFNAVIDFPTTVKQLRQDVLAAGRGTFHLFDMKYSVLFEQMQETPVALISARNSWNPTWRKRFLEVPHAVRVRYVDEDSDYKQNERIIYADGYSAANATIFEDEDAGLGVTHQLQVFKMKRRELAEAQLRADDYTVEMDFEHLVFTRGDRVELQQDLVLAALSSGRLRAVTFDGVSLLNTCTVDEPVVMEAGQSYGMRIRTATGVQCVGKLVTVPGTQSSLSFVPSVPGSSGVAIGDLYTVGLFGQESVPCIVKSIRPGQDFSATVALLDYAPAIYTAESIPVPPYEGHVTNPQTDGLIISPPSVDRVQSDEAVLVRQLDGALQSRILITVTFASGFRIPVDRIEAQFRPTGSESPWRQLGDAVDGTTDEISLSPVEDGVSYDFRLRSVDTRTGATSEWNATQGHTVIGKSTPPADVTLVVIEGDRMRWNYADPARDFAGFQVRYRSGGNRTWADATPAHDGLLLTTDFTIFRSVGFATFLVKAVDVAGNESVNPGSVTINFGDTVVENVIIETNHRTLGWPGTKTNGTVVSNQLQASTSSPFWTVDSALFWSGDDSALFWTASYLEMSYEITVTPPLDLLDATLKLSMTILGDWTVFYRTGGSALMWNANPATLMWNADPSTLMWSDSGAYTQWPGSLAPLTHQDYDIKVVTKAGLVQGILDQFKVILDVPDLVEEVSNLTIVSGGTRLPLTGTYRSIAVVNMNLLDDAGTAAYLKIMDKDPVLYPLIKAFNSSDVTTGATINATVQGY